MSEDVKFVFDPQGVPEGSYRKEYPELDTIPEFQPLTEGELKIVWWYACPTSPLLKKERHMYDRMRFSFSKVYPNRPKEDANDFARMYKEGVHPKQTELQEAIERMRKVKPIIRNDVSVMLLKIITDYFAILEKPLHEFVKNGGETDFSAYVNVRTKIQAQLDDLVQKAESGYGLRKVSDRKDSIGEDISETYLKSKAYAGNNNSGGNQAGQSGNA